ncbi:MAG TPA: hypothetical protein VL424_05355 [Pararobbsia sp.]|jgi:hypothetical protein|nr:hypothetical protein [Pararobbsia sp.]
MSTPTPPAKLVTEPLPPATTVQNDEVDESPRPHDGDHNQGGARPAGLDYQRELGTEQDA